MNFLSLLKDCAFEYVQIEAVAGTTTLTTTVSDMNGWDGICYLALTGDATNGTVLTLAALGSTANATGGVAAAITGATCTYTAASTTDTDNKLLILDVVRPVKRYIYATLTRGTQNCVCNGILAIKYRGNKAPITQSTSHVVASALAAAS
jgi:hypothetical protein